MRRLQAWFLGCLCLGLAACLPATAQNKLDKGQLDQLLAPVALYPDALLSQILMGATYPDDIAAAALWSAGHASQSGDPAVQAVQAEPWDPTVKSLVAFPSVMDMMGRQPEWVRSLGDAFLAQPDDVMDSVQRLRAQARQAGNLNSTPQQKVTASDTGGKTVVVIEPTDPQVIYVPSYNPAVVYGTWPYPAYPPAYYPPPPGSAFATSLVAGIGFGLGVAAVDSLWGGFNWGRHDVDINVNRYNNINVNQRINAGNANGNRVAWQHNPERRGNTPYADPGSRQRFDSQRQGGPRDRGPAGSASAPGARDAARERAAQSFQGRTGQPTPGHMAPRDGGERPGQGGVGARAPGAAREPSADRRASSADRQAATQRQRADAAAARDRSRANNGNNALRDAGNGDRMRQQAQRGERAASAPRGGDGGRAGAGHAGGGGGRAGGGGGGGHFGGRR